MMRTLVTSLAEVNQWLCIKIRLYRKCYGGRSYQVGALLCQTKRRRNFEGKSPLPKENTMP
jgi:hypothetical protein